MNPLPLRIVLADRVQRAAAAVLLPGDDAGLWLDRLDRGGVPLDAVEFLLLPTSRADRQVSAALAILPEQTPFPDNLPGPRYGRAADNVWVPVESRIEPPVADGEWTSLLPEPGAALVWHPALGLTRIEREERLRARDLVRAPEPREADWSRAVQALPLQARLHSIEIAVPPTLEDILGKNGGDIGQNGNDLEKLPGRSFLPDLRPLMALPALGIAALARVLGKGLQAAARAVGGMAGGGPSGGGRGAGGAAGGMAGGGFLGRLMQKLGQGIGGMVTSAAAAAALLTPRILSERAKAIQRLLRKFDIDPDDALRFSIPMTGDLGRGIAPPGFALFSHLVDFALGGMSSGGPVDVWNIPFDLQAALMAKYRAAAEREIRLGRYRRAAYIFSRLLGDDLSAAGALENGKFHREAAVLYRDKLNRPIDAARCLERGGHLREAIEIYREQKRHVEAGDLFARLDELDEADAEYRVAVAECRTRSDFFGAAHLLDEKIQARDEALRTLEAGWPESAQAEKCLRQSLDWLAEMGRHDTAGRLVASLADEGLPLEAQKIVLQRTPDTALQYPDPSVQAAARESVQVVASRVLEARYGDVDAALRAVERLVPSDRLLGRDCRRFRPTAKKRTEPLAARSSASPFQRERVLPLRQGVEWQVLKGTMTHYFVAGWQETDKNFSTLLFQHGRWDGSGAPESVEWHFPPETSQDRRILMTVEEVTQLRVHLTYVGGIHDPPILRPAQLADFRVETPGWFAKVGDLAVDSFARLTWSLGGQSEIRVCDGYGHGVPVLTRKLEWRVEDFGRLVRHTAISVRESGAYVSHGRLLYAIRWFGPNATAAMEQESFELPAPITQITGTVPHTVPRLAALWADGARLFDLKPRQPIHSRPLELGLSDPMGVFLRDGRLVLWTRTIGGGEFVALSISDESYKVGSRGTVPFCPVAMIPTNRPNEFACCTPQGLKLWTVRE